MLRLCALLLLAAAALISSCSQNTGHSNDYTALRNGFLHPEGSARPKVYWWWLNGNVDTVRALKEMEDMKQAGIGGFDIFEIGVPASDTMIPAGPAFMGDSSLRLIQFAIREAGRLNLEVGLNLASSWNAGGAWTLPRDQAKSLYFSTTRVSGTSSMPIPLPFPSISRKDKKGHELITFGADGRPAYHEDVAVIAIKDGVPAHSLDTSRVLDLSDYFDRNKEVLNWSPPSGDWLIYRYVCSNSGQQLVLPSPNSHGPIIDHFDSSASRSHVNYFIDHLRPLLGPLSGTALKSFYLASYEAKGSVWTPGLPEVFNKLNGYPVYKFLPALFDTALFKSNLATGFASDYARTLSQLMIQNLYREAGAVSHQAGLSINSESGGPGEPLHHVPTEPLEALGAVDIPRGEFWNGHYHYNQDSINIMQVVKEVSAAAHIYGRKLAEEESFTSFRHWQEGPGDLKPLADRAFCEGMNRVVMHGFSHSPRGTGYPGNVYHAGTHVNDKNPWWPMISAFVSYLARVSYMLQQTDFQADVLHYYGDRIPNYVAPKNTRFKVGRGYDYEVINTDVLERLRVRDHQVILPDGSAFPVLSLGETDALRPRVLAKLKALAEAGAVISGPKPEKSIGLSGQPAAGAFITAEAAKLWDTATTGFSGERIASGKVFSRLSPLTLLQGMGKGPDFICQDDSGSTLDYIHTRKGDLEVYFIRNTTDKWVSRYGLFRQSGKSPELWDPMTGKIIPISIFEQHPTTIEIPLTFPPDGSFFVVFRNAVSSARYSRLSPVEGHPPLIAYTATGIHFLRDGRFQLDGTDGVRQVSNKVEIQPIIGPWKVSFSNGWGAPDSVTFPDLMSWTESKNDGIRYYSGIASYRRTFVYRNGEKDARHRLYLDLGDLSKIGKVWLNEKLLGVAWTPPYRFDITSFVRPGENELKIEVANTWSNRLVGDAITGEKYTRTNITTSVQGIPWSKTPLIVSGLLGPVTLQRVIDVQ